MTLRKLLLTCAASVVATTLVAVPAAAAVNDGFDVWTADGGCGMVEFVDYGEGWPGGGNNDDYLIIHDYCADGHGVKAWAWLTENTSQGSLEFYLGGRYNGNGEAGAAVLWDPFADLGVEGGDKVTLKVCLSDGDSDPTPFNCKTGSRTSADG
jgi:hypothetical protein